MSPIDDPYESDRNQKIESPDTAALGARLQEATPVSDNTNGVTDVPVNNINLSGVDSPADFRSPDQYAGMYRDAQMLDQMRPAIAQGANADTFQSWDQANQIGQYSPNGYTRGYADVYHSYYDGNEQVAVEPKADGTYDVLNGRHRIFAARQAGLMSIPAKIVG